MFDCFFSLLLLGTPILLLTFVSLRGVDYLPELSRRGFVSLLYLISPILARPFLDTIKTAGAPACSAGEWGGVPSVPELSSSVLIRCFHACILMFSHLSCILHSSFCLGLASPVCSCIFPEFARSFVPSERRFFWYFTVDCFLLSLACLLKFSCSRHPEFFYYNGINVCILFLRCFPVMIWCVFPLSFSYTFFYCLICCS